jgi:hypothetical protein
VLSSITEEERVPMPERAEIEPENMVEDEAASFLRVKPQTLAKWRTRGEGPEFSKLGGRVVYTVQALRDFIQVNSRAARRLAQPASTSPRPIAAVLSFEPIRNETGASGDRDS